MASFHDARDLLPLRLNINVLLLGAPATGKTCIAEVFTQNCHHFRKDYFTTTRTETFVRSLRLSEEGAVANVFVLDCPGNPLWHESALEHYESSNVALIVYDVNAPETIQALNEIHEKLVAGQYSAESKVIVLANKVDLLNDDCSVSLSLGKEFAKNLGLEHFEISAKNGDIEEPFKYIADKLYQEHERSSEISST